MRTRGSVRFAPYFKVQWFEERSLAWKDVQRSFHSVAEAERAAEARRAIYRVRTRIVEITMESRRPLDPEGTPPPPRAFA